MGGNVVIDGYKGQPIEVDAVPAVSIKVAFFVVGLNYVWAPGAFEKAYDTLRPSWAVGSTWLMYQMDLDWLKEYKPFFGDIDLAANEEHQEEVSNALVPGAVIGGVKVLAKKESSKQTTIIGEIYDPTFEDEKRSDSRRVQIDISFVPYVDGRPTPLMEYMHRVSVYDVEMGFKGAFSKNLLSSLTARSMTRGYVRRDGGLWFGVLENWSLSTRGLRARYALTGEFCNGFPILEPVSSKTAHYVTDPSKIFTILFSFDLSPSMFYKAKSVEGICDLIDKYYHEHERFSVFDKLVRKMYRWDGCRPDMSFSADPDVDRRVKRHLKNYMRSRYPDSRHWMPGGVADNSEIEYYSHVYEREKQRDGREEGLSCPSSNKEAQD